MSKARHEQKLDSIDYATRNSNLIVVLPENSIWDHFWICLVFLIDFNELYVKISVSKISFSNSSKQFKNIIIFYKQIH